MKYLLALFGDESDWGDRTPEEQAESMKAWDDYTQEVTAAGAFLGGEGLSPSATATTVRIPAGSGDPVLTDGPFAETKEQLGGYYLLECADLDEALGWARKIPLPGGAVEVRPVMDYEAAGSEHHSNSAEAAR
jgi:hypothetical protein